MISESNNVTSRAGKIAVVVMTALLILAVVFMQARMLFLDAPFILFNILNNGHPMIMEHRYGSIITQIWPWLGSEMGLPLDVLLSIYNLSFNIFYLLVALLMVFKWKEYGIAVLIALYYTLMAGSAFFWTNNEIHQAMGWFFVWLGVYRYQLKSNRPIINRLITFEILSILAVITHPLMIPIIVFSWIYMITRVNEKKENKVNQLLFSGILSSAIVVRILLSTVAGWYDQEKLTSLKNVIILNPLEVFQKPIIHELIQQYMGPFWLTAVLFIISLLLLLYFKKYLIAALYLLFIGGYHYLFLATFDRWIDFYSRSELMPLSILIGLPIVTLLPKVLKNTLFSCFLILIFAINIAGIIVAAKPFIKRKDATFALLDKMEKEGITKAKIITTPELDSIYIMTWGLPVETLMASAFRKDNVQRTIKIFPTKDITTEADTSKNIFMDFFKIIPVSRINSSYFKIDTTSQYQWLDR